MASFRLPASAGRNDITLYLPVKGSEGSLRAGHATLMREVTLTDLTPAIQVVGLSILTVKGVINGSLIVEIDYREHKAARVLRENLMPFSEEELVELAFANCDVTFELS